MPADQSRILFGKPEPSEPQVQVQLPHQISPCKQLDSHTLRSRSNSSQVLIHCIHYLALWEPQDCSMEIDIAPADHPQTLASWYDIWLAGVAINTMCVQNGMSGSAIILGKSFL